MPGVIFKVHFVCLFAAIHSSFGENPVIETKYGKVQGRESTSFQGRKFYAFHRLPFAEPPVGERRFQDPVKPQKHDGVLDGTVPGEDCIQRNTPFNSYPRLPELMNGSKVVGVEDCLYLNVYTPNLAPEKELPVMFYIHGGGFEVGSSAPHLSGPDFLLDKDIVLVTTNYRLGPLGFLTLENDELPGNYGLKDQVAALEWTKENIRSFGGDPNSITVFGESAGGASVDLLMTSPLSKDLLQRGIAHSGTRDCIWVMGAPGIVRKNSLTLAEHLGCPTSSSKDMLSCLRQKPAKDLIHVLNHFSEDEPITFAYRPVFEDDHEKSFVTKKTFQIPSEKPMMLGFASGEGLYVLDVLRRMGDENFEMINQNYSSILPDALLYKTLFLNPEEVTEKVKKFYLGAQNFSDETKEKLVLMGSDAPTYYGTFKTTKAHKGSVFLFLYNHRGERSNSDLFNNTDTTRPNHGDDMVNLFYQQKLFPKKEYNQKDSQIRGLFLELWTNFARNDHPYPTSDPTWKKAQEPDDYFDINSKEPKMIKLPFLERMKFWSDLFSEEERA